MEETEDTLVIRFKVAHFLSFAPGKKLQTYIIAYVQYVGGYLNLALLTCDLLTFDLPRCVCMGDYDERGEAVYGYQEPGCYRADRERRSAAPPPFLPTTPLPSDDKVLVIRFDGQTEFQSH